MDHFESLVATLLEAEGYWVKRSFKVKVTKEEKRDIGKHSIPRPEMDLLALDFAQNKVMVLEAKSYLDSPGVKLSELNQEYEIPEGRYKLFTCKNYRKIVLSRLHQDLIEQGMANTETRLTLGLVAGNVYQGKSEEVRIYMEEKGWLFWSPDDIKQKVVQLAQLGYENDPAIITAKILMR